MSVPKQIVVSETVMPPESNFYSYERGVDPWHEDAFPAEFKASAPHRGERAQGWYKVDYCGNVVGFVADGEVFKIASPGP